MIRRCHWCGEDPLYVRYHDEEWGRPVTDDAGLYERMCLEGFQAGLSWITILRKRENFRAGFAGFNPEKVAGFGEADVARLLQNSGIVRHRGKIEAAIGNAGKALDLIGTFGSLHAFFMRFQPDVQPGPPRTPADIPAETAESRALSKELRRRGFRFVGPVTMYAHMQATGIVNDHCADCAFRNAVEEDRRRAMLVR